MRRVEEIPPYFPISDFMKGTNVLWIIGLPHGNRRNGIFFLFIQEKSRLGLEGCCWRKRSNILKELAYLGRYGWLIHWCLLLNENLRYCLFLQVGSRRSRRWLNDFLLIELVPRLNAEEIRGLFAPPPFGNNSTNFTDYPWNKTIYFSSVDAPKIIMLLFSLADLAIPLFFVCSTQKLRWY